MSSFTRRIQRTVSPSQKVHPRHDRNGKFVELYANPPRKKGFMGRGAQLGVTNPRGRELLARQRRESDRSA